MNFFSGLFMILGSLSLLYYFLLYFYTGHFKTTFSFFWPVIGVLNLAYGLALANVEGFYRILLLIPGLLVLASFFVIASQIVFYMVKRTPKKLDYIIVLGAQVRGEKITDTLQRRLARALLYLEKNKQTKVVVSGGRGKGEDITEAKAMEAYLLRNNIAKERIVKEEDSRSTKENLLYTSELIDLDKKIGIVTSNFHVYRAVILAKSMGYSRVYGISSSCRAILLLNYLVREYLAVLWIMKSRVKTKGNTVQ